VQICGCQTVSRSRSPRRILLLALGGMCGVGAAPCYAEATDASTKLATLSTLIRQEKAAIQTVQVRYVTSEEMPVGSPIHGGARAVRREVSLFRDGLKFRQEYTTTAHGGPGGSGRDQRNWCVATFDGEIARTRDSSSPGLLVTGRSGSVITAVVPDPEALVSFWSIDVLESQITSGKLELLEVADGDDHGGATVRVRVRSRSTGFTGNVWYARDRGYLFVRGEDIDRSGNRVGIAEVSRIEAIRGGDGSTFYYPIEGSRNVIVGGREVGRLAFHVERESVRLNEPVPDKSMFALRRAPTERAYDADLQTMLEEAPNQEEIPENEFTTRVLSPATAPSSMPHARPD